MHSRRRRRRAAVNRGGRSCPGWVFETDHRIGLGGGSRRIFTGFASMSERPAAGPASASKPSAEPVTWPAPPHRGSNGAASANRTRSSLHRWPRPSGSSCGSARSRAVSPSATPRSSGCSSACAFSSRRSSDGARRSRYRRTVRDARGTRWARVTAGSSPSRRGGSRRHSGLERRLSLKQRDGGVRHVILLVAGTPRNRRALRAAPAAFGGFSRDARAPLRALRQGEDPGANAIILL